MANSSRYVTNRALYQVNLKDGGWAYRDIEANTLVTAEEKPVLIDGKSMRIFTVQIGALTSKTFVIEDYTFDESFEKTTN